MKLLLSVCMVLVLDMCCFDFAKAQQSTTSVQQAVVKEKERPSSSVDVVAMDNRIIISNAPIGSKLEIYSVVGIKVAEIEIKVPSGEYPVDIAKGYYIVRIGKTVRKVAIR
jgi:hypothetical protein